MQRSRPLQPRFFSFPLLPHPHPTLGLSSPRRLPLPSSPAPEVLLDLFFFFLSLHLRPMSSSRPRGPLTHSPSPFGSHLAWVIDGALYRESSPSNSRRPNSGCHDQLRSIGFLRCTCFLTLRLDLGSGLCAMWPCVWTLRFDLPSRLASFWGHQNHCQALKP